MSRKQEEGMQQDSDRRLRLRAAISTGEQVLRMIRGGLTLSMCCCSGIAYA